VPAPDRTLAAPAFVDRADAGRRLADAVAALPGLVDPIVLALPRGGVPIGAPVARRLGAPLDVLVVRKLGVPGHEELAMGAVASGGIAVLDDELIARAGVAPVTVETIRRREEAEVRARVGRYRGERPPPSLRDRSVIVVDDGVATGSTMLAAVAALRSSGARELIVAVPVAAAETCRRIADVADRFVCLKAPEALWAISLWYEAFDQVRDDEVRRLLGEG
jgi:predicted phosphoribosyltransferase